MPVVLLVCQCGDSGRLPLCGDYGKLDHALLIAAAQLTWEIATLW